MGTDSRLTSGLMRVKPDDPEYARRAAAEASFWQHERMYSLESLDRKLAEGPIDRYVSRRFTDSPNVPWEDTICRYREFRRGLVLGVGAPSVEARILETNPGVHLTLVDISSGPLERHLDVLNARFLGRVGTRVADLNFIELDEGAYDLIVSSGTIHHVINLEYLAFQINRSLTNDGYFFLQDYVAEPRWRFSEAKRRLYEAIVNREMRRQGRTPGVVWESEETLSPLCGVRSDETLAVFREFLDQHELRTAGALLGPMMRSKCAAPPAGATPRMMLFRLRARLRRVAGARTEQMIDPKFIEELTLIGDALEDSGAMSPNIAFAVYRKRAQ